MTVYVPQDDGHKDLGDALRFGELHVMSRKYVYPDEVDQGVLPQEVRTRIELAATLYNPRTDFLLPIGDQAQVLAFTAALARRSKTIRVLRYDRQTNQYLEIVI